MKSSVRIVSLLLVLMLVLPTILSSCQNASSSDTEAPIRTQSAEEYTLPLEEGHNQLTFYCNHNGI